MNAKIVTGYLAAVVAGLVFGYLLVPTRDLFKDSIRRAIRMIYRSDIEQCPKFEASFMAHEKRVGSAKGEPRIESVDRVDSRTIKVLVVVPRSKGETRERWVLDYLRGPMDWELVGH